MYSGRKDKYDSITRYLNNNSTHEWYDKVSYEVEDNKNEDYELKILWKSLQRQWDSKTVPFTSIQKEFRTFKQQQNAII